MLQVIQVRRSGVTDPTYYAMPSDEEIVKMASDLGIEVVVNNTEIAVLPDGELDPVDVRTYRAIFNLNPLVAIQLHPSDVEFAFKLGRITVDDGNETETYPAILRVKNKYYV